MIPWTLLGSATVPGSASELRLHRRGTEYSIRVGGYELMNSRVHASEDALATVACGHLARRDPVQVLIGGLGMGFTLAAVLKEVGPRSRVTVAELVPGVVEWNRGVLGSLAGHPLDDPRVTVREEDVTAAIRKTRSDLDAILLDVDNGPAALTSKENDRLYSLTGLRAAFTALRPRGVLAVWSGGPDPAFTRRLQKAGFEAEEIRVRGRGKAGGPRYLIWLARRPAA